VVARCTVPGCTGTRWQVANAVGDFHVVGLCGQHYWASFPPLPIPLPRLCDFDGCQQMHLAKGLCGGHYNQKRRGGRLRPLTRRPTAEERYWEKVDRSDETGCWLWTGAKNTQGYGYFSFDGDHRRAQYFAWEAANGPVPEGLRLARRPTCPKDCVRPTHWQPKTVTEINRTIVKSRRKRSCRRSQTKPEQPESVPTPPAIPATRPSPPHWKARWLPLRASS
jgi:hypothetical protein